MSTALYLTAGVLLFALGAFRAFFSREGVRRVIALNVMSNGVFLVLLTRGASDPVPQAMVLTGIVVAAAATGLALAFARRLEDDDSS